MFKYGKASQKRLDTCDATMQLVLNKALAKGIMDITIVQGHRGKEEQNEYYYADPQKSRVKWPDGKHNRVPSDAIDAAPFINGKISWNNLHCCVLAGIILATGEELGVKIRWGGNWDMDSEPITDQDFQDLVHYERVRSPGDAT